MDYALSTGLCFMVCAIVCHRHSSVSLSAHVVFVCIFAIPLRVCVSRTCSGRRFKSESPLKFTNASAIVALGMCVCVCWVGVRACVCVCRITDLLRNANTTLSCIWPDGSSYRRLPLTSSHVFSGIDQSEGGTVFLETNGD